MKKLFSLSATLITLLFGLSSCHIVTPEEPLPDDTTDYEAYGLLTVPSSGFTKENVRTRVVLTDDQTLDIYMYDVKFATMMPVTIDMLIRGVSYSQEGNRICFCGDSIVPTAGNKPYEKYIVTDLKGFVSADSICLSNNYGDTPAQYEGLITK